jgi:hypothetical protein
MDIRTLVKIPGAGARALAYAVGWGVGFGTAAYLYRERIKNLEVEYQNTLEKEIAETKQFYKVLHKRDIHPEELVDPNADENHPDRVAYETYAAKYDGSEVVDEAAEDEEDTAVTEDETIHEIWVDELNNPPEDYRNNTVTFFRGDRVLAHEDGQVIYHPEEVIGLSNYDKFDDIPPHVMQVFYRDPKKKIDWIVDLDSGAYADTYIQHSYKHDRDHRKVKKFRVNDE